MIKTATYIRSFTPQQRKQLEAISQAEKIKTTKKVLLFTLEKYDENQREIERLKRIIAYKQNKIDNLKSE